MEALLLCVPFVHDEIAQTVKLEAAISASNAAGGEKFLNFYKYVVGCEV